MSKIQTYKLKLSSSILFPILYLLIDSILYNSYFFFSKATRNISIENLKFAYEVISFFTILFITITLIKIYGVKVKVKPLKLINLISLFVILLFYVPMIIWVSNKIVTVFSFDLTSGKDTNYFNNFYYLIVFAIITPLKEELFFRGFLFNGLKKRYSLLTSILATSVFFGISHLNPIQMITGILFGIIASLLYHYTSNFVMPFLLHTMNNIIVYIILNGFNYIIFILSAIILLLSYYLLKKIRMP